MEAYLLRKQYQEALVGKRVLLAPFLNRPAEIRTVKRLGGRTDGDYTFFVDAVIPAQQTVQAIHGLQEVELYTGPEPVVPIVSQVVWHIACEEKPDSEITVLGFHPEWAEPEGVCLWDSGAAVWRGTDNLKIVGFDGKPEGPLLWCHLPEPPDPTKDQLARAYQAYRVKSKRRAK